VRNGSCLCCKVFTGFGTGFASWAERAMSTRRAGPDSMWRKRLSADQSSSAQDSSFSRLPRLYLMTEMPHGRFSFCRDGDGSGSHLADRCAECLVGLLAAASKFREMMWLLSSGAGACTMATFGLSLVVGSGWS